MYLNLKDDVGFDDDYYNHKIGKEVLSYYSNLIFLPPSNNFGVIIDNFVVIFF